MARIALKVDVDTWRGTREGVPALVRLLATNRCGASFLFSLGPDHTGRAILRVLRPGFLGKVSRTSVLEHYGLRTLLHGVLLPGPDIGLREAATLRSVREELTKVYRPPPDDPRPYSELLNRLGASEPLTALVWLGSHGCDVEAETTTAEALIGAYRDTQGRAAMLATLASLHKKP